MHASIHVTSWKTEGITLTSPADPEFDSLARSLFRGNSEELLKLKPFLVIISNNSGRTLVAYTLCWEVRMPDGRPFVTRSQHKYPDAVAGSIPMWGNEIRPGEQGLIAEGVEIYCGRWNEKPTEDFCLRQFAEAFERFVNATEMRIGLDAVVFDDGELIGPDISKLNEHFAAYLQAKQDLYCSLLQSLDSGQSMDQAFRPIEAVITAPTTGLRVPHENPLAFWSRQAAAELRVWRKQHGDAALPDIVRRFIRKEPFVVQRVGENSSGSILGPKQ
jgi:hypothetical protein